MKYELLLCVVFAGLSANAQKLNPSAVRSAELYDKSMVQIKSDYKGYVTQTAKALTNRKLNLDSLRRSIKKPGNTIFSNLGNADVEALVFLVLQANATENEADLKNIRAAVEKNNQKKEALRKEEQRINDAAKASVYKDITNAMAGMEKSRQQKDSLRNAASIKVTPHKTADSSTTKTPRYTTAQIKRLNEIKNEKDSIDEMTQHDQLQLQQLMDKKNQLETMISNIMKAQGDTLNNLSPALKAS